MKKLTKLEIDTLANKIWKEVSREKAEKSTAMSFEKAKDVLLSAIDSFVGSTDYFTLRKYSIGMAGSHFVSYMEVYIRNKPIAKAYNKVLENYSISVFYNYGNLDNDNRIYCIPGSSYWVFINPKPVANDIYPEIRDEIILSQIEVDNLDNLIKTVKSKFI